MGACRGRGARALIFLGCIAQQQALAAIGQVHLMRYYEDFLQALDLVRLLFWCVCVCACGDTLRLLRGVVCRVRCARV